jgi:hypothetical protein
METAYKPNGNGTKAESKQVTENNGNGSQAECIRPKSRMETAHEPNPGNGSQAESYLYTDLKNRSLHTDHKNHAGEISPVDNFSESTQKLSSRKQSFLTLPKPVTWLPMTISTSLRGSGRPSSSCTNAQQSSTALWQNRESRTSQPGRKKFACCARSTAAAMTKSAP